MRLRAAYLVLALALTARAILGLIWLLPPPVGDGKFFLTASQNLCQSGFFGTTAYPIDPSGHSRMVWHGFVSPMLYAALNPGCRPALYYLLLWIIEAATASGIVILARLRGYSPLTTLGLASFALAAQYQIGFRPETLAMLLIVAAEIAFERRAHVTLGVLMGTLLCTQPTLAGLHGLVMATTRPELLRRWVPIACAYLAAVLVLFASYPFPVADLAAGLLLQARISAGRADAGLAGYYLFLHGLPGWGLLLAAAWILAALRKPWLALTLPALWFFGPRAPPTTYNVIPICLLLTALAAAYWPGRGAWLLGLAGLAVGAVGLSTVSLRDTLTVMTYGDTFGATRTEVARAGEHGRHLHDVPPLIALTNPELRPTLPGASAAPAGGRELSFYEVDGRPEDPCPGRSGARAVSLALAGHTLFHSNGGWMVYACPPD